jgi:hypothetical protein
VSTGTPCMSEEEPEPEEEFVAQVTIGIRRLHLSGRRSASGGAFTATTTTTTSVPVEPTPLPAPRARSGATSSTSSSFPSRARPLPPSWLGTATSEDIPAQVLARGKVLGSAAVGGLQISGEDRVRRCYWLGVEGAHCLRLGRAPPFVPSLSLANTVYLAIAGPDLPRPVWARRRPNFDAIFQGRGSEFTWRSFASQAELFSYISGLGVIGEVREV